MNSALLYCAGGGIGDSLLATIVARALRSKFGTVDALTLPAHVDALQRVPDVSEVLADDGEAESELAKRLEARYYEACVVTWATARTAHVPQLAHIPVRVGQANRLYSWRFTHSVPVRSERGDVTTHWTQILLDYARVLGCDTADTTPRFEPAAQDEAEAANALQERGVSGDFGIMHPTNAVATQRGIWPLAGWVRLAADLRARYNVPILVTGSEADRQIVETIAAQSGAVPFAGALSIGAYGALCKSAKFFAGITTGTMHVAGAVGCPTVGIFPFQTDTPERWKPLGSRTAIVRATYPCRSGERKETCPDYACIEHLDVPRIVRTVESLVPA